MPDQYQRWIKQAALSLPEIKLFHQTYKQDLKNGDSALYKGENQAAVDNFSLALIHGAPESEVKGRMRQVARQLALKVGEKKATPMERRLLYELGETGEKLFKHEHKEYEKTHSSPAVVAAVGLAAAGLGFFAGSLSRPATTGNFAAGGSAAIIVPFLLLAALYFILQRPTSEAT